MEQQQAMNIAYICAPRTGEVDLVLEEFSLELAQRGVTTSGLVQVNSYQVGRHKCDMDVRVLPDGPTIRISQSLGNNAKGCRLDPAALERAVSDVNLRLTRFPEVLIVNKFGKHEASGRGFRDTIAEALIQNTPVVVGVNQLNFKAFQEFCGGSETHVQASSTALMRWFEGIERPSPRRLHPVHHSDVLAPV
ncbi:MAG: DUF2478 domain-containing protein [Roseovarius sp.]|nr:DUF2478 domain-containing protein [Roseovarius sp.]